MGVPSSVVVGRAFGAPVRLHASLVLGVLLFTGFRIDPYAWFGFVVIVLVHELGHALLARRAQLKVREIVIHGFGGYCAHAPTRDPVVSSTIAWGGVLAQGVLGIATLIGLRLGLALPPSLARALLVTNLYVGLVNLLPFASLDGASAWRLFPALLARRRRPVVRPSDPYLRRNEPGPYAKRPLHALDSDVVIDDAEVERIAREVAERALREAKRSPTER